MVGLRYKWNNEPRDFTPWLAENIAILNEAVGIELEVENTEVSVGPYSADILAKDTGTGRYVVIENQLEKTNHDHLGKSITYASVLDASTIIWIASEFTEEHKKALDWLNDHTSEEIGFFGVKLELWQIDDSLPAVRLNVVSQPVEIIRQTARNRGLEELSDARKNQLEFWMKFRDRLAATKQIRSLQTPRPQYWFDVTLGKAGIHLSNIYNTDEGKVGVRVYIGNKIAEEMFPYLEERKEEVEAELGMLSWDPYPENRDKIIALFKTFDMKDRIYWDNALDWLCEQNIKFSKVFGRLVRDFKR